MDKVSLYFPEKPGHFSDFSECGPDSIKPVCAGPSEFPTVGRRGHDREFMRVQVRDAECVDRVDKRLAIDARPPVAEDDMDFAEIRRLPSEVFQKEVPHAGIDKYPERVDQNPGFEFGMGILRGGCHEAGK